MPDRRKYRDHFTFDLAIEIPSHIEVEDHVLRDNIVDAIVHYDEAHLLFPGCPLGPGERLLRVALGIRDQSVIAEPSYSADGGAGDDEDKGEEADLGDLSSEIRDTIRYLRMKEAAAWSARDRLLVAESEPERAAAKEAFTKAVRELRADERVRRCLSL